MLPQTRTKTGTLRKFHLLRQATNFDQIITFANTHISIFIIKKEKEGCQLDPVGLTKASIPKTRQHESDLWFHIIIL